MSNDLYSSDILVIGSGLSGLLFSIKAIKKCTINLVTKGRIHESATNKAQGGLAVVISDKDSFEKHIADTINAGAGLCHRNVVETIVRSGPARISELIDMGVKFSQDETCSGYELGLEGGHSKRRILHVKDHTGKDIEEALVKQVLASDVAVYENHLSINLYTLNNRVYGAYVLDTDTNEVERFVARVTVLATGGAGRAFLYTSNPDGATGDGIAMAYRAGATIMNMEMMQFHPTLLYHRSVRSQLISEALRGEGAILLGNNHQRFMSKYHPDAELAPRDIVARAIDNELKRTGEDYVLLDISFKDPDYIKKRFPAIYEKCMEAGIDITKEAIPVVPAAHYIMGGVRVDINGRTDVKGLYAIGETACTGFHGGNRLASNSLLEAAVIAHNAAEDVTSSLPKSVMQIEIPPWDPGEATDADELIVVSHMWNEIRRLMTNYVGIWRSNKRLIRARNRIDFIAKEINEFYWDFKVTPNLIELRNIAVVAELIIRMARMRKECRGAHFNKDYRLTSWHQAVDTLLKKGYSSVE